MSATDHLILVDYFANLCLIKKMGTSIHARSYSLADPGGHIGPRPQAKMALLPPSPKKNRICFRVRSGDAEGESPIPVGAMVGEVSFLLPGLKRGQRNFRRRYSKKSSTKFLSQVFSQKKSTKISLSTKICGPLTTPFQYAPPPPHLKPSAGSASVRIINVLICPNTKSESIYVG